MDERRFCYTVRSGRQGLEGWRAAIALPTRHGEIVISAVVPDGAITAFRDGLRRLTAPGVEGAHMGDVSTLIGECGLECVGDIMPAIQSGLSMLGPYGAAASAALGAITSLFGGGPPPPRFDPNRPPSLPAPGTVANLSRIMAHVGVRTGMPVAEARRRLESGMAQRWNENDHNDAARLVAVLPPGGTVSTDQLAALGAAQAAQAGRPAVPEARPAARPAAAPQRPAAALPPAPGTAAALVSMLRPEGALSPAMVAPALAAPSTLALAHRVVSAVPGAFEAPADFARMLRAALTMTDAVSGAELVGMESSRRQLANARARSARSPVLREALAAARGLHQWMHENPLNEHAN